MIHKIKLRKATKNEIIICPYNINGICHRNSCIYLPHMECMKSGEYRQIMKSYAKYIKGKKKSRERGKKQ